MSKTMADALVQARAYDRVVIRRMTWDGCTQELMFGQDGDRQITPKIEIAYDTKNTRIYELVGTTIEHRQREYGGDDYTCLVANYREQIKEVGDGNRR